MLQQAVVKERSDDLTQRFALEQGKQLQEQLQHLQQLMSQEQQSQQLQPQLTVMPDEIQEDPFPQVPYSVALPAALNTSQTFGARGPLQQPPLLQLQQHASMQPQVAQPVPRVGLNATKPASGFISSLQVAAIGNMERVVAMAQSSLVQIGLLRDHLANTSKQLGEAVQPEQVSNSLRQGLVEQDSDGAINNEYSNEVAQMAQALFAETVQMQQRMHQLHEHLSVVAAMQNTPPQGADMARALNVAGEGVAKAEAVARNQSAWAQAEQQRLQMAISALEKSTAYAQVETQRATIAEAREHKAEEREHKDELLLRDTQTRELIAEQHEIQFERQAGREIKNLRGTLEQAHMLLQKSRAELQRTQTALKESREELQRTQTAVLQAREVVQEEATRTAAAVQRMLGS